MLSSVCTSSDHDFFVKNDCDNNPEDTTWVRVVYILYAHTKYIEIVQIEIASYFIEI